MTQQEFTIALRKLFREFYGEATNYVLVAGPSDGPFINLFSDYRPDDAEQWLNAARSIIAARISGDNGRVLLSGDDYVPERKN